MLIQVLDDCIIYHSIIPETLCDILLYHAESNKNMNVRTSCLNWFESNLVSFLTDRRDVSQRFLTVNSPLNRRYMQIWQDQWKRIIKKM